MKNLFLASLIALAFPVLADQSQVYKIKKFVRGLQPTDMAVAISPVQDW